MGGRGVAIGLERLRSADGGCEAAACCSFSVQENVVERVKVEMMPRYPKDKLKQHSAIYDVTDSRRDGEIRRKKWHENIYM